MTTVGTDLISFQVGDSTESMKMLIEAEQRTGAAAPLHYNNITRLSAQDSDCGTEKDLASQGSTMSDCGSTGSPLTPTRASRAKEGVPEVHQPPKDSVNIARVATEDDQITMSSQRSLTPVSSSEDEEIATTNRQQLTSLTPAERIQSQFDGEQWILETFVTDPAGAERMNARSLAYHMCSLFMHWHAFHPQRCQPRGNTFLLNSSAAIVHKADSATTNHDILRWMSTIFTIMETLSMTYPTAGLEELLDPIFQIGNIYTKTSDAVAEPSYVTPASIFPVAVPIKPVNTEASYNALQWYCRKLQPSLDKCYQRWITPILKAINEEVKKGMVTPLIAALKEDGPLDLQMMKPFLKIVKSVNQDMHDMPKRLARVVSEHICSTVDVTFFNELLQYPREVCCCSGGMTLKIAVAKAEEIMIKQSHLGDKKPKPQLSLLREVCNVLLMAKGAFNDASFRASVCKDLSISQLYHLLSKYHGDEIDQSTVPAAVLSKLQQQLKMDPVRTLFRQHKCPIWSEGKDWPLSSRMDAFLKLDGQSLSNYVNTTFSGINLLPEVERSTGAKPLQDWV